jgi:hypothetical protein
VPAQSDRQGKKLTGQQTFLAGHCPLTVRYFERYVGSAVLAVVLVFTLV